jgi:hypothetical protein
MGSAKLKMLERESAVVLGRRGTTRGVRNELSAVGWEPAEELSAQEWAVVGRRLGKIGRASQWWIGDWIKYGTHKWGEKYVQAARITGYDIASLRNMAWVATQFDLSLRNDKLTWSHHALLASLDRGQKRHWLKEAVEKRLSVADLRAEIRSLRSAEKQDQPKKQTSSVVDDVVCPKCGHRVSLHTHDA